MRIKRDAMRCGRSQWDGTERWPEWRKLAKRVTTRRRRRQDRAMVAEF